MSVTADTSHADRSWLKDCALANTPCMLVTANTFHDPIGPCGPAEQSPSVDSFMHCLTAALSSAVFWGANAALAMGIVKMVMEMSELQGLAGEGDG